MEPKILIGIPTSDNARFHDFYDCLERLEKPFRTEIYRPSYGIAKNRNIIIRKALADDFTHILFLDDDMVFGPNLLIQLLSHNKDVVNGLCLTRFPFFTPVLFDGINLNNDLVPHKLRENERGLIKIWASGLACTLINTKVFKNFIGDTFLSIGFLHPDELSEDISFYIQLESLGYEAYCDLNCHVGHHINAVIWPGGKITVNNLPCGWKEEYDPV